MGVKVGFGVLRRWVRSEVKEVCEVRASGVLGGKRMW